MPRPDEAGMLVLAVLVLVTSATLFFTSLATIQHEVSREPSVDQARDEAALILAAREQVLALAHSTVQPDLFEGLGSQIQAELRGGNQGLDALALGIDVTLAGQEPGVPVEEADLVDATHYRSGLWTVGGEECLGGLPADGEDDGMLHGPDGQLLALYLRLGIHIKHTSFEEAILVDVKGTSNAAACS